MESPVNIADIDIEVAVANSLIHDTPAIEPVVGEKGVVMWRLIRPWRIKISDEFTLIIGEGSGTNLVTSPWYVRWLISSTDAVLSLPAMVHDQLVREWDPVDVGNIPSFLVNTNTGERKMLADVNFGWIQSAKIFKAIARRYNGKTARFKANIAYAGVRIYGFVTGKK